MTLAAKTYSAARWTTASSVARAGLQLMQIVVLARFLTPTDYGLMAMVLVVLSYAGLFSDMGLSTAFVQRQQISHEERSSLYWLSVAVGGALMLIVMAISPLAAMFFKEPQLIPLMLLIATNFLVIAFGQQLRMDAEKSLNFRPVALIEISAAMVGFAVAVFTAWLGWGVYALVVAAMISAWLTMFLSWRMLAQGWRPAWRLRWSEVRWFARFGGGMVLNNVINHVNFTVDLILGGRILGAGLLGLYSVPRNLILQVQGMVNPIFTRVGFPLISSIQYDKERVKQVYLKTMNMTATINAPIYVAIAVFAPEIVLLMLGPKWMEAGPLMRVLALWGLLRSFGNPAGSLLFGLGHVRLATKWNAALLFLVIPVVWFGSQWGAIGMAWAMAVLMAVLFVPGWLFLIRPTCGAGLGEYSEQIALPTLQAGLAGLTAWYFTHMIGTPLMRLILGLCIGITVYAALLYVTNKQLFYFFKNKY
ncbi:Colanic acid exporter [Limnobacter sp. 130]|uniref:MOP flippase family protein n=1 Tax=Limnobacter sp. 130 TaxID=2653147 RepID=UPI0012F32360|nr:MOP flippase family protein [Limnobacter sp. 130]VWX32734.1 Colanic acid exporter [Limnobacter sp. 130]